MALVVNGTNIPTNGDFVKYNGTKLTKVVQNGATVWEKVVFTSKDFSYTGNIQSVTLPPGLYLLEVWGAKGGDGESSSGYQGGTGGNGGYSKRYYYFSSETTVYICVGKMGDNGRAGVSTYGGYNGGGNADIKERGGSGGGATHIATRTGVLKDLASYKSNVLVVAGGGGGGGAVYHSSSSSLKGGAGGGLNGGNGSYTDPYGNSYGCGGTQSQSGSEIHSNCGQAVSGFGFGQNSVWPDDNRCNGAGGGGGWYGGGCGGNYNGACAGGGGSGYIGVTSMVHNSTTYTNTTTAGNNSGNGKAKITHVSA